MREYTTQKLRYGWMPDVGENRPTLTPRRRHTQSLRLPGKIGGAGGSDVIQQFNAMNTVEALMIENGYEESPRGRDDWRSPYQTSDSYATRVFTSPDGEQSWVSLSDSDAQAGLGAASPKGHRYGDAFDLHVHFDHDGNFTAALRGARAGPQEGHGGDPEPLDWSSLSSPANAHRWRGQSDLIVSLIVETKNRLSD